MDDRNDSTGTHRDRRSIIKAIAGGLGGLCLAARLRPRPVAAAQTARMGLVRRERSPWFTPLEAGRLRCDLCPRHCRLDPGRRGACRVRENNQGTGYTLVYGNPCLVQIDPVERKPFYHVLPGSRALSISTAGCPIECKFCEVWDMALVRPEELHAYDLPPDAVVEHAREADVQAVSYAFGEPVAFYEYMADTASMAKEAGLLNLLHTSGYIERQPLEEITGILDAVNIDLKSFCPQFYRDICSAELDPVLETLKWLKGAGVHLEITNILIPTLNDDMHLVRRMCSWIRDELGADVPLHFTRFYPLYKLANLPQTPASTMDEARSAAQDEGLQYVYVGKVTGHDGENTYCPGCAHKVIDRTGFVIEHVHLTDGACNYCGRAIPGIWS